MKNATIVAADIETLEMAGDLHYRNHENEAGIRLHALALRLREETGLSIASPVFFACFDVDESAGLADVVELRGYSKKVVCD